MDTTIINSQTVNAITFDQDNFAQRRASQSGAGVAYDPDSLLTGADIAAGFDYENSTRVPVDRGTFSSDIHLQVHAEAIAGERSTSEVLAYLPRRLRDSEIDKILAALIWYQVEAEPAAGRWNWYEGE